MRPNNRTYGNILFVIGIFCLIYLCFACDKNEDKSENQKKSKEFANKMIEHFAKPDQEIVGLLAVKYNKSSEIVENIVDIYLTDTDLVYRQMKSTSHKMNKRQEKEPSKSNLELFALDKSVYADTVAKISSQVSFEPAIVASILIDYKTWKAAKSRADSQ